MQTNRERGKAGAPDRAKTTAERKSVPRICAPSGSLLRAESPVCCKQGRIQRSFDCILGGHDV